MGWHIHFSVCQSFFLGFAVISGISRCCSREVCDCMLCFAVCLGIPSSGCGIPIDSDMFVRAHPIKPSVRNTLLSFGLPAPQLLDDAGSRVAADVIQCAYCREK